MPIQVRGTAFLNTVRSVRGRFGNGAHDQVLAALSPERRAVFLGQVRDAAWVPMDDLVAYLDKARELFAPADGDFHRALGREAGLRMEMSPTRAFLGDDPREGAARAAYFWRTHYDQGRVEVEELGPRTMRVTLLDFRTVSPTWCERNAGFLEGCLEVMGLGPAHVEEERCVHRGDEACVLRLSW